MAAEVHILPVRAADCLKLCYLLKEQGELMTAQTVCMYLQSKEPSGHLSGSVVTHVFERLSELGYVSHTRYHGVQLTQAGEIAAAELVRHYRLLKLFLVRILSVPLDQADGEAERLEHVLSEELEERIDELLAYPSADHHGDPIPDRMGRVRTVPAIPLTEVEQGRQVIIARLSVHDPDLVRYVAALGLVPGVVVRVATRTVYGDVLTLQIGESSVTVGNVVASQLLVHAVEEGREATSR